MIPDQQNVNEIAWNGIRFLAPADWHPSCVERNYLVLEQNSIPILEIKWGQIKGSFSHDRHLQQLSSPYKKAGKTIRPCRLPEQWEKAIARFQTGGFQWQGPQISGTGAILFCPACRNVAMIQFYQRGPASINSVAPQLLASFRDHSDGEDILWSAFDIRAEIPSFLQLRGHRFEAGYFELKFASKKHVIVLNRWSPASVLLAGKDLAGFAASVADFPRTAPPQTSVENPSAVDWTVSRQNGGWLQLANRLQLKPSLQQLRMWAVPAKNRILAVRTEGRRPLPGQVFEAICKGFRCV